MFNGMFEKIRMVKEEESVISRQANEFREKFSGNSLENPELEGEAAEFLDAHFQEIDASIWYFYAINPEAKFIYFERKYEPKQYKNLVDVKGDFVEEIAVAAVEDDELKQALDANTLQELDDLEKHGATSELVVVPPNAKWVVTELGLEPTFCETLQEVAKAIDLDESKGVKNV